MKKRFSDPKKEHPVIKGSAPLSGRSVNIHGPSPNQVAVVDNMFHAGGGVG
jgi:uncharacterized heparinase superfamily protein